MKNKQEYNYLNNRVFQTIKERKNKDLSFIEEATYSNKECREFWFQAMAIGMEIGLHRGSIVGQKIDLVNSCKNNKQKEFLKKYYELAEEYNCAIVYQPKDGMFVMDLKPE